MGLLVTNATVLTVDADDRVIDDGAVLVEDGRIAAVGPSAEVEATHAGAARVIDGTGKVVLPGFVSTHNHVGYTFFRGRAEDAGLGCVTGQYFPMATVASREERLAVGSLTYAELLKSGVTTTLEMEEEADVFAPFVESLGVRSFMGIMTHDVDVDAMAKDEYRYDAALREAQLRQAVEFAQDWHGRADGRIRVMMTPNMTISSSPELLRSSRQASRTGWISAPASTSGGASTRSRSCGACAAGPRSSTRATWGCSPPTRCAPTATWWTTPTPTCSRRRGPPSRTAR